MSSPFRVLAIIAVCSALWGCRNPSDSDVASDVPLLEYHVQTIHGQPIQEGLWGPGSPVIIALKDDRGERPFEGMVNASGLGWLGIQDYPEYVGEKNSFYVDVEGRLSPGIETIDFEIFEITSRDLRGQFAKAGPTIDAAALEFTARRE